MSAEKKIMKGYKDIVKNDTLKKALKWTLIAGGVWFVGSKIVRSTRAKSIRKLPIQNDYVGVNNEVISLTNEEAQLVRTIAIALHENMVGINDPLLNPHDYDLFADYLIMSDTMFSAVYINFQELYASEGKGSLYTWIQDEIFFWQSLTTVTDSILDKMRRLGLNNAT